MNTKEKNPSVVYKHYHALGKILPLYDYNGRIAGFQFPLIDDNLPLGPPYSTFSEAKHVELMEDPLVAQNPLVRYTLSVYQIEPARLRFAQFYYKGMEMEGKGDEWIRIAVNDKVDLRKLQKFPQILNSSLTSGAISSAAVVMGYLYFSFRGTMSGSWFLPLMFFVAAGAYIWFNFKQLVLVKRIVSGPDSPHKTKVKRPGWMALIPGLMIITVSGIIYAFDQTASGMVWFIVGGIILCLIGWFLWKFDIIQALTGMIERAQGVEDNKRVAEKATIKEVNKKEDDFLFPAAIENLSKKDDIKLMDIVNFIKTYSERQQAAIIRAIPYQELRLDKPGQWTDRHERLFRFCLLYSEVLMNYKRIKTDHPAYDLPELLAIFLNNMLVSDLIQQLGYLKAKFIPLEAGERLLRWTKQLVSIENFDNARQCFKVLKRIRSGKNPQFLPEVLRLEKEVRERERDGFYEKMAKEKVVSKVVSDFLSVPEDQTGADVNEIVEKKLELLGQRHLKSDTFTGYEPFYADVKKVLNSVEQLIVALKIENTFIVAAASEALGEIADKKAVGPLIDVIKKESNLMNWEFPLEKAMQALGCVGDPRAITPLKKLLVHDDGNIRSGAELAIEKIIKKQNTSAKTQKKKNIPGRKTALESCGNIDDVYAKFKQILEREVIVGRNDLLTEQAGIMLKKVEEHRDIIPKDFLQKCRSMFEKNKFNVLKNMIECELNQRPQSFGYTDVGNKLYFVVSTMPWTREEAIEKFLQNSTEAPFGYINQFTNLINDRPSRDLINFFQFLFCMGGGRFEIHICMARMRSESPKDGFEFTMYPIELLNANEKRQGHV